MIGVVAGIPLAMLIGRALSSSLYGVKPLDALTYALAVAGVAVVALVASRTRRPRRQRRSDYERCARSSANRHRSSLARHL